MADSISKRRHRFQFSLRSLLIVVTIFALAAFGVRAYQVRAKRLEEEAVLLLEANRAKAERRTRYFHAMDADNQSQMRQNKVGPYSIESP
jgi:hypothetical protein